MSESTQNKISKLYQILSGKISNKRYDYPLFEWDTLLDFLLSFYDDFCDPTQNHKDKAIGIFNKLYSENVKELKNLRISKNDFDVVKTIGKGHFGEVIVVKEKNTSNVYAMKVLKKKSTLSQDNMAFFFEERDIMAFANSEWVTALHYSFQDSENLYLVMEFLPGGDLLSLLNRYEDCLVDEETCRFYLSEIIIATNCVHKIGYVHRDIKPENVLLDLTGHIKLADFGSAARLVNGKQVFGKMPVGTPEYIAPEVLTSMDSGGGKYGVGCDYWSIGVVAYEMLFGELPFESDSVLQLYNKIMHFSDNLEFPDDIVIKPSTKNLICGLICEQGQRLNYSALAQHDFFKNLDWTTIKNIPPPHVPMVTSRTDTSNFDDINSKSISLSDKSSQRKSKGFTAANVLPFVGFTFTRSLNQQLEDDTIKNMNGFIKKINNASGATINTIGTTVVASSYAEDSTLIATNTSSTVATQSQYDQNVTDITLNENKALTAELENAKKDLKRTKKELIAAQSEVTRIESDKQFYIQETDKLKTRYKELSQKYDVTVEQSDKIDLQGHRLLTDLLSIFDCCQDFTFSNSHETTGVISKIKSEYSELKKEKDESNRTIQDLTSNISMLNYRVELLTKNIKENEERYNVSCGKHRETVFTLETTLEKTTKEYQTTISSMKLLEVESGHQIKTLTEELERLKITENEKEPEQDPKLLGVLQSDLNTANSSVNLLTNENNKLVEKLNESNDLNSKLRNELINLQNRANAITKEINDIELESNQLKSTVSYKNMIISDLNEKISTLEREKVEIMCELELTSTKLKSREQFQSDWEKKILELRDEIEKHKAKEGEEVIQLTSQLKVANNRVASLTVEFEDKVSSENFFKSSLENAQEQISKVTEEFKNLEQTHATLESEVQKCNDIIHSQKVSNYSLTELVEKLKEDAARANNEKRQVSNEFEEFKAISHEDVIRLTETLKQQEKLIEFLQKMNEKNKKPQKSDSKDDHYRGNSFEVVARTKRERTTKLNKFKSHLNRSKQSVELISFKTSEEKAIISRNNSLSKPDIGINSRLIRRNETVTSGISNKSLSGSEHRLHSFNVLRDHVIASSPHTISTPVSILDTHTRSINNDLEIGKVSADNQSVLTIGSDSFSSRKTKSSFDNHLSIDQTNTVVGSCSTGVIEPTPMTSMFVASEDVMTVDPNQHTFTERFNLCKNVCMVCYNLIQFGVKFNVCKICYLRCHAECSDNVYVQCIHGGEYDWFCYIPTIQYCQNYFCSHYDYNIPAVGWVNMLTKIVKTKTEWEPRWMIVTEDSISFYKQPKPIEEVIANHNNSSRLDPDLIESLSFDPGDFSVHINMRTSETLTYAGTTDSRSYWFVKVTPKYNTITRKKSPQSSSLLFSTPLQDKTYWVAVLSHVFNQYTTENKTVEHNAHYVHHIESIDTKNLFNICHTLNLNNEVSLVATSNELFLFSNGQQSVVNNQKNSHLLKLNGFTFVSGMTSVKDSVFIICGKTRLLIKIENKLLINELKSKTPTNYDITKLTFSTFLRNCHIVKAGKCSGEFFVAVGIGERFILLKPSNGTQVMDISFGSFIKNIHFTSIGVIFQTDFIYILNIKNGGVTLFLDPNDTTLSVQIFGQKSAYNFFLDVFTLKIKKHHEEFLLCYSELGIFVNRDGKRTRNNDLIWSDVPTEFHMVGKNLLCVCYFDKVDVYDLSDVQANTTEFIIRRSYPVLSPSIIHHTTNSIHVCASDAEGNFWISKLDLP